MKEGHEVFGEEDSNGYTAPISSRDEDLLDPSDGDFDRRKFSAASVDILIGKKIPQPYIWILYRSFLDGLDLKREKEKASGAKKKKIYNEQEEMESQRRLQEQLQNIEPPKCGPKCFDVSL